jgi:hypothetical protein
MAKGNARQQAAARRDKRAKVMLGVFGLVFLAVIGFEVPHLLKHGSSPTAAAGTGTTAVSTTAAGGVPAAPGATPGLPGTTPQPQSSQLVRFSEFATKDPFRVQVSTDAASSSSGSATGAAKAPATTPATPAAKAPASTTPKTLTVRTSTVKPARPTMLVPAALLQLDGKRRVVAVGSTFPANKPVFRLEAVGHNSTWISLVHGMFAGGVKQLLLKPGHPTKVAGSNGKTTYVLELVRVTAKRVPLRSKTTSSKTGSTTTTTVTTGQTTTTTTTSSTTTTGAP